MCLKLMMITVRSASSWSGGDDVRTGSSKIFAIQFLVVLISNLEIKKRSKNSVTRKSAILIFFFWIEIWTSLQRFFDLKNSGIRPWPHLGSQTTFTKNSKVFKKILKYVLTGQPPCYWFWFLIFKGSLQVCFQKILN